MTCQGCKARDEEIERLEESKKRLAVTNHRLVKDLSKASAELDQKRAGLRKIMEAHYRHCHSVEILDAEGFRREVDEALNESGTERWC